jgi:NADPH-dependent glutamate synthase beta subunit-like oxidoreductase
MRRIEARNYAGAARVIREQNPFGEVCGLLCTPNRTCQKDCNRRDFTDLPVRIAELQQWVCAEAGQAGWLRMGAGSNGQRVAVIGGGPSALSCAYYLNMAGYQVKLFASEHQAGGLLWIRAGTDPLLQEAVRCEVQSILSGGITFEGGRQLGQNLDLKPLLEDFQAVYLPEANLATNSSLYETWLGRDWMSSVDPQTGQVENLPKVFINQEYSLDGVSVVEAAASGRRVACAIDGYLHT